MFKCKWLKKLLGLKSESVVDSASKSESESEPVEQPSAEASEQPAEEVISQ